MEPECCLLPGEPRRPTLSKELLFRPAAFPRVTQTMMLSSIALFYFHYSVLYLRAFRMKIPFLVETHSDSDLTVT